jgi:hypothetical protein
MFRHIHVLINETKRFNWWSYCVFTYILYLYLVVYYYIWLFPCDNCVKCNILRRGRSKFLELVPDPFVLLYCNRIYVQIIGVISRGGSVLEVVVGGLRVRFLFGLTAVNLRRDLLHRYITHSQRKLSSYGTWIFKIHF